MEELVKNLLHVKAREMCERYGVTLNGDEIRDFVNKTYTEMLPDIQRELEELIYYESEYYFEQDFLEEDDEFDDDEEDDEAERE